jgi:cytochrome c biogenesis protein
VYRLDQTGLEPVLGEDGSAAVVAIRPGETVDLPDGLGTVTWDDLPRFIAVDLRADPSLPWLLCASIGAFVGIAVSLFGTRRRIWLHLTPGRGKAVGTLVAGAVLAPPHDLAAHRELKRVMAAVAGREAREDHDPHRED